MNAAAWDEEISPERRSELVTKLAAKIVQCGMASPSILLLEMHKPFAFVASQTMILGSGFLAPFIGFQVVQEYSKLLESTSNIELLIRRIEQLACIVPNTSGRGPIARDGSPDHSPYQDRKNA